MDYIEGDKLRSQYVDALYYRKNKREKILITKNICEQCGKPASHVHHKDGNKVNHDINNLIVLCRNCHFNAHNAVGMRDTKYSREYGMTIRELSEHFGITKYQVRKLHDANELHNFIDRLAMLAENKK